MVYIAQEVEWKPHGHQDQELDPRRVMQLLDEPDTNHANEPKRIRG